jgi:hypothetical protein
MELNPQELQQALPFSYKEDGGDFITAVFVNGCDCLSQMNWTQVESALDEMCLYEESPYKEYYRDFVNTALGIS